MRGLFAPVHMVQSAFHQALRSVVAAWEGMRLRQLLYGLPAILAFAVFSYVAVAAAFTSKSVVGDKYLAAGRKAFQNEQYAAAKLYLERANRLHPGDTESLVQLAKAAQLTDDMPRVAALMEVLAPDDEAVDAESHFAVASQYMREPATPARLAKAELQLQHVVELRERDLMGRTATMLLGEIAINQARFSQAISLLEPVARDLPRAQVALSKAYALRYQDKRQQSDVEAAARWAKSAAQGMTLELERNPGDRAQRILCSDAYTIVGDFSRAAQLLREGLQRPDMVEADKEAYERGLARVLILWSDSLKARNESDNHRQRFELLAESLRVYPNDLIVFDRMMTMLKSGDEVSNQAREFLLDNIAQGKAVGISHLLLGSDAFLSSNEAQAQVHLEMAMEAMPNAPVLVNNLAWFLNSKEPPEPDKAFKLIEPLVARYPQDARFLDTRGHIQIARRNYREGIDDLEKAMKAIGSDAESHKALATAYRAIGLTDLADRHDVLAAEASPKVQAE